ncbi:MAG: hypothetical protein ACK55Z_33760 [bacterium]
MGSNMLYRYNLPFLLTGCYTHGTSRMSPSMGPNGGSTALDSGVS